VLGRFLLAALAVAGAAGAETRRVEVPLLVPSTFVERTLVEQVFTEPGATARIVARADPCSEIVLSKPALLALGDRFLVTAHASAEAGFQLAGRCRRPFAWEGELEAEQAPRLTRSATAVEFPVVNSWLRDESRWLTIPALWDWVKPEVHPRLEVLRIDLAPVVDELRRSLPLFAAQPDAPALAHLVGSLALADVRVEERGLRLHIRFEVDAAPAPGPPIEPEAPLTQDEIAAFEARLYEWDAFLTFVIKSAGREALDPELRASLLAVLLDARHEMLAALDEPAHGGEDRVRALFVSSWRQLQPALTSLTSGESGLRFLAFVAAGDALAALDAAGPSFGFEISRDGLRRLARSLVPDTTEDPLHWSEAVDPVLRETFGFDAELPSLAPPEPEPEEAPPPEETPAPEEAPPPKETPAPDAWRPPVRSVLARLLDRLLPAAFAAPVRLPAPGPETSELDGFVPRLADLDQYLPSVAAVLRRSATDTFRGARLAAGYRSLFEHLTLATAWQESCWRQYVRSRNQRVPLRSSIGALGLMQVNPRVWRGFYSVDGLSWSIAYNARAGSEILLHYLRDYAISRSEDELGGIDALARASYAAYHGGPRHLRRYREPSRWKRSLVSVDRAIHDKYREVAAGRELGVRTCFPG
jgi:soluble lytic murein transglycosylase-like protein